MISTKAMQDELRNRLSKKRFQHSMRVAKMAEKIAIHYHFDPEKAYFAGMVHDIAKELDDATCQHYLQRGEIDLDPSILANPNLAHGEIGAIILKEDFDITDEAILDAVRWHTYGHPEMTLLSKIVYIADVIELKRDFTGVDLLRKMVFEDINACIIKFVSLCTIYLSNENTIMHHNTLNMLETLHNEMKND